MTRRFHSSVAVIVSVPSGTYWIMRCARLSNISWQSDLAIDHFTCCLSPTPTRPPSIYLLGAYRQASSAYSKVDRKIKRHKGVSIPHSSLAEADQMRALLCTTQFCNYMGFISRSYQHLAALSAQTGRYWSGGQHGVLHNSTIEFSDIA